MVVAGRTFTILQYPKTDWIFSYERLELQSGNYVSWDRGISADRPMTTLRVKGSYADMIFLSNRLLDHQDTFTFEDGEYPFGPHVDTSSSILCYASNIKPIERINTNFWMMEFTLATELELSLRSDVTASISDLWYPSDYVAGKIDLGETVNISSYGDYNQTNSHTKLTHSLTFDLDISRAASAIKYFTDTVRADAFTLPTDWASLNPFAGETYTHAIVLSMSYEQTAFKNYKFTLDLQGYNNG